MNFVIADTFTDSLARLAGEEQKAVKTTAFALQLNPAARTINRFRGGADSTRPYGAWLRIRLTLTR